MASSAYYRCSHCRGFYEVELGACKFCGYKTIVCGPAGEPRVFPDRATCRAIQIAEYEQLPAEAMADCFKPAKDELEEVCGCLHCGPEGPLFEAVEMRWMVNEQMWACPCTTCGGRGFNFDIHPLSARWECAECRHKWKPPDGNYKRSNCTCPKCGCREASGMFQDEYSEEEIDAMTEEEYAAAFGQTRAEEEREWREFNEKFEKEREAREAAGIPEIPDEQVPWDDEPAGKEDFASYDPEARAGEVTADEEDGERSPERMPDDIDFPRPGRSREERRAEDGDIPF